MLSSLRLRLIFLVLIAVLPVLGLTLYITAEGKRRECARIREDVLRLASIVVLQEKQLIDGMRQLLVAMAELPVVRNGDTAACNKLFQTSYNKVSRYANLGAIKPDGEVFCSAISFLSILMRHLFFLSFKFKPGVSLRKLIPMVFHVFTHLRKSIASFLIKLYNNGAVIVEGFTSWLPMFPVL